MSSFSAQRLAIAACLLVVCFAGAQAQSYPNFIAALGKPQFSSISQIVKTLNLATTFSNPKLAVTVFVPNNNAFAAAQKATGINVAALANQKSLMQTVVYYHIVKEVVKAPLPKKSFTTFVTGKTLTGDGMMVKGVGSSAKIVDPNVVCGAGIAHGIDNVLLPIALGGR